MPFNSLSTDPVVGYPGQIAEPAAPKYAKSYVVQTAIKSGQIAKRGTDAEKQIAPLAPGDTLTAAMLAGVVLLSTSRPYEDIDGGGGIEPLCSASCLRLGLVYMQFAGAVTAGQCVAVALATGEHYGYAQGAAANTITTGRVIVPGLRIAQTTTGAGPAIVEVNLLGNQDAATVGTL